MDAERNAGRGSVGHLRLVVPECPEGGREPSPEVELLAAAQAPEGRRLVGELTANGPLGVYISGLPGVGKSTLLLHMILDDIRAGRSCCVLDPHGDLIREVLTRLPDEKDVLQRIVLFDPADTEWPVGIDLLDARTERGQNLAVQFMIDMFEELFLPDHQGPMLHQSVRNGMRLLMETDGSLAELPVLFAERDFLKKKLALSRDPWVRHYFEKVWLEITGSSRGEYLAYFTSKLSAFLDDLMLRGILGQRGGLDFARVLADGGVLLANLSRGAIGETNSRLLGMILLHKLERLAVERSVTLAEERVRVHVYVEEFHEFATKGLSRFLSTARKFNIGLTLAHQRLETLDCATREAILGSVGHVILFRQGASDALSVLPQLLWPRFGERELLRLPNYHAVARATDAAGRHHLGRLTVPSPGVRADDMGARVRALTRARFARSRHFVEAAILSRLGWQEGQRERFLVAQEAPAGG